MSGPRSKAAGAGVSAECRGSGERLQGEEEAGPVDYEPFCASVSPL